MIKIAHVISGIGGGGRERRMGQLAIDLHRQKFAEQHIIYFKETAGDYPEIIKSGVKLHLVKYDSKKVLLSKLYSTLNDISPDIVHTWCESPIILLLTSFMKLKLHYKYVVGFLADGNRIKSFHSRLAAHLSYCFSNAIISNSYAGLKAKGAKGSKTHVIYNGFDFQRMNAIPVDNSLLFPNLPEKSHLLCMIARFSPAKDWNMFLNVAEKMGELRKDVTFLAIGSGPSLKEYQEICISRRINNILFLGQRSDVETLIKACDISVLFTNNKVHAEGVSNTIMETMAASCPIIATLGGGTVEIIDNGKNGFIIPPGDVSKAVELIDKLLSNPQKAKEIASAAHTTIQTKFLLKEKTQEYISLYNSIL